MSFDDRINTNDSITEEDKRFILKNKWKLEKLLKIIDIDTVGWASPKVLIDTIRREVINK